MAADEERSLRKRLLAAPRRWPVRWRLALVSGTLTLAILITFAGVVGQLASERLRNDFQNELRAAASELAFAIQVSSGPGIEPRVQAPDLRGVVIADRAAVRIVDASGRVLRATQNAPPIGPPQPGLHRVGAYQVATVPVGTSAIGLPVIYVQYARERGDLEATIEKLWLFLGGGVLAGALLALLAGLAVAGRAMRPIASLTAAARKIASTRDPSRSIPRPQTEDEVAELARTLDDMLRSLDRARAETQAAMQRQREFVADASHELRTPLTSILANLELLQESLRGVWREDDRAAVESALRSSRRMSRLVSDLLLLARADAGQMGRHRACDLAEVARAAVAEVEPVAADRELVLDVDGPVPLQGNPDELHRLVLNLIDNAVRHTPGGSRVEVAVRGEEQGAVLEVSDDGPGIGPELREQLFRRFVRGAGPADRTAGEATGLGLAIVKAVANAHSGRIEVGSSPLGGARFAVHLPSEGAAGRAPEAAAASRSG